MRNVASSVTMAAALACIVAGAARAQGTAEQREACTSDALKLCPAAVPDVTRTTECMKAHRAELSARCQATFAAETPTRPDTKVTSAAPPPGGERRSAPRNGPLPQDPRYVRDPDAEVAYVPPRRVIAPPLYGDPGPPLNPGGVPYDELFAGPTILDVPAALDELDDPYLD